MPAEPVKFPFFIRKIFGSFLLKACRNFPNSYLPTSDILATAKVFFNGGQLGSSMIVKILDYFSPKFAGNFMSAM